MKGERSKDELSGFPVSRRGFLKIAGGGILVLFTVGPSPFLNREETAEGARRDMPSDFNAFLRIGEDGKVSCFTGKIEMGQGIVTSLAQMLADELDVPVEAVSVVMGDTDLCPWDMGTFGSMTTRSFGPPLRAAGAEARRVLLELASEHLRISLENLVTKDGFVVDKSDGSRRVSYGTLSGGKRIERRLAGPVAVKKRSELKVMSKPLLRKDALEKVTGRARYAGDIQLPGMLYARILRPPAHGARLKRVDLSEARKMKEVQVVQDGDLIAVLHRYPDVAETALDKIKADFEMPASGLDDRNIFDHLLKAAPRGEVLAQGGDPVPGEGRSRVVERTYLDGYVAHAPIEPHAAVVKVEGDRATVWPSAQTPFRVKEEIASTLRIPEENVRVISPFIGGGFGGKSRNLQAVEAARLSRLTGRPVQVAWSRKEEFFHDTFRPAAVVKIRSGTTDQGGIGFWDYHVYYAGQRGAAQFYNIPHHRTTSYGGGWGSVPGSHPFATGAWRAPGNNTNTFARESHIDIMAAEAGIDPLKFRLDNLSDEKMKQLLRAAAEKFGWKAARAPSGRGFGIACGTDAGTYVATMAEVEVDKSSGRVKVRRVVCAQDMGLAINPEGAAIQMEGCVTMGLGYALAETIHFRNGEIFDINFDTYEIPRFSWVPKIEIVIVDDQGADPQGGGEPAIITMGAVLANAIYDTSGARVLQMPMTPERIKEAIRS